jgi:hypothetical protein
MRRVNRSASERARRAAIREERVERLEGAGIATGGFAGGGSVRSTMSPDLLRRVEAAEALEDQKVAREQHVRAERARQWQESQLQSAITEALLQGEESSPRRLRGETLGSHTERVHRIDVGAAGR